MYWCFAHMHVCVRAPDPQELELQMVVSCRVGAGNQTQVLWKSNQLSSPMSFLPNPK